MSSQSAQHLGELSQITDGNRRSDPTDNEGGICFLSRPFNSGVSVKVYCRRHYLNILCPGTFRTFGKVFISSNNAGRTAHYAVELLAQQHSRERRGMLFVTQVPGVIEIDDIR